MHEMNLNCASVSMKSSSSDQISKKKDKLNRMEYLDQLVVEFQTTNSKDAKEQVLANLANFAYDPVNFVYLRELKVLDLFLDCISDQDETFVQFSIAGLCNLSLDPLSKEYIIKSGLKNVLNLLKSSNESIMLSVITTLMFLVTPQSKNEITSNKVIQSMLKFQQSKNRRLKNLATIFLEDYCSKEQITKASQSTETDSVYPSVTDLSEISLPDS